MKVGKKRKSKQQIQEAKEFKELRERAKQALTDQSQRAIQLRSKDREFHGLERELIDYQSELVTAFQKSKYIKHPRDVGTVREVLLRNFLIESGLLPRRYSVSHLSTRVASASGHISNEIDIAIYDGLESISLMKQVGVYEVLPVESVFGVIQVKSTLSKFELRKALTNIASFKRLQRVKATETAGLHYNDPNKSDTGFGLIFAFDTDMDWYDIADELRDFAKTHESKEWTNAVFILKDGFFMHGEEGVKPCVTNNEIASIKKQQINGQPDHAGLCLWSFYNLLIRLLRDTTVTLPHPESYLRLPLVSGQDSYYFQLGHFAEFDTCARSPKHGDYQRKISQANLRKLVDWCQLHQQIDLIAEQEKIFPRPASLPEPSRKQQHYLHLYNPDGLPIKELLFVNSTSTISYDLIVASGKSMCIPYFYSTRDGIIDGCPKCRLEQEKALMKSG